MTYTSTELSELTGFDLSQVSPYLYKDGYKPVGVTAKRQNIWDEECLEALMKRRHRCDMKNTITLAALSVAYRIGVDDMRKVLNDKGVEPLEVTINPKTGTKTERYAFEVKDIIADYFDSLKVDEADKHPLVTDKRCLRLNWFPDTVPICFEDLDEEIA